MCNIFIIFNLSISTKNVSLFFRISSAGLHVMNTFFCKMFIFKNHILLFLRDCKAAFTQSKRSTIMQKKKPSNWRNIWDKLLCFYTKVAFELAIFELLYSSFLVCVNVALCCFKGDFIAFWKMWHWVPPSIRYLPLSLLWRRLALTEIVNDAIN